MSLTDDEHLAILKQHSNNLINSSEPRRLVVAGPGAGKTTSFKNLLKTAGYSPEKCLVFTFLGTLKKDLEDSLGLLAQVYTFHGYCHHLLRKYGSLRNTINGEFIYFPGLGKLISADWSIIFSKKDAPEFEKDLQSAENNKATDFYIERANYYNSVGFNDSVFRVLRALESIEINLGCDLILVDEFQDFNKAEANFVRLLEKQGIIVIAGDDDQALYEELRTANPEHIQNLYDDKRYENHFLPYCTRCTEAIVETTKIIIEKAMTTGIISRRIPKEFSYCPPIKRVDSEQYPKIKIIRTSVQKKKVNYFGKYILSEIMKIKEEDIRISREGQYPTCLIIAANPFREQISVFLKENSDYQLIERPEGEDMFDREKILREIGKASMNQLWWRAILQIDQPSFLPDIIIKSHNGGVDFINTIPKDYQRKILLEIQSLPEEKKESPLVKESDITKPTIQITSFEGSKGLSATHVFIAGLQNGTIPNNPNSIQPMEVKKIIVALTRTRKCCHMLYSTRIAGEEASSSEFLKWIPLKYREDKYIDKAYFDSL